MKFIQLDDKRIEVIDGTKSDEIVYIELIRFLDEFEFEAKGTLAGPDCDLIHCSMNGIPFIIVKTIDGNGVRIVCEDANGMKKLMKFICMYD